MTAATHVLYVDDDPEFVETTTACLEREADGLVVDSAASPEAALDRLDGGDIDCVVSAHDMSGLTGIEFLDIVRERHGDLPFIIFTGQGSASVADEAISAGVTDYLRQGTGAEQYVVLAHRISKAVSAHRSVADTDTRRRRLEGLLKTVPGCIVQLNAEGEFVFANDRAEEVLELERSSLIGQAYDDPAWQIRSLEGDPLSDDELPFRRIRESGDPVYGYRHRIEWPDGTEKVLRASGAPVFDDAGDVESVVFSLVDETEWEQQRQTLADAERRLDLAAEVTDTGVWEWTPATGEVVWNETLERVMGLEPGSFEGTFEAFADRVHPEDLPTMREQVEEALASNEPYHVEFRMLRENGDVLWVEGRGKLVDDGGERRMVGIHHDITERKRRLQELERTKGYLDGILDNTTAPMFMKDRDGEYLLVNRGYEELFGLAETSVVGHTDAEIHPDQMVAEVRQNDRLAMEREETVNTEEGIVVDGEKRHFLVSKAPIYVAEDGTKTDQPAAIFGVAKDVTEREQTRERLERQNDLLEEFASVVSHDLKSPLTVAEGRIELADTECDSDHLDAAADAIARSRELVDNLLTLARSGERTTDAEPVALAPLTRECWATVETEAATLDVETTRTVEADRSRLQQLIENLVTNAVEHAGADCTVTVGDCEGGFYVADDGPGVPEEQREDVFSTGYSTASSNTGLGLGIVSQVVVGHGWRVELVESEAGGARFEITGVDGV